MKRELGIEKIKNIIIVALLFSALLLLSFFWTDVKFSDVIIPIERMMEMDNESYKPESQELIKPNEIIVGFGTEDYTKTSDEEVSNAFIYFMKAYFGSSNYAMEEITKDQYQQIMEYKSVEFDYNYNIPLKDFILNNLKIDTEVSVICESFSKSGYSAASPESMFLYDKEKDTFYRLIIDTENQQAMESREALENAVDALSGKDYTSYYKAGTFFGGENDTLIPYALQISVMPKECSSLLSVDDSKKIKQIEEQFFGSSLDFVRKITENKGSLLYMYGYSEKVLTINEKGLLQYTEEFDSSQYEEKGLYESLNEVIDYISTHCGWDETLNDNQSVILTGAEVIYDTSNKRRGYRFRFGLITEGISIYNSDSSEIMAVEIFGTQVTKYIRDIISIKTMEQQEQQDTESPIDILTNNYSLISRNADINEDRINGSYAVSSFDKVVENIDYMALGYLRDTKSANPNLLLPCWKVKIRNTLFYFDTVKGSLLSVKKEAV